MGTILGVAGGSIWQGKMEILAQCRDGSLAFRRAWEPEESYPRLGSRVGHHFFPQGGNTRCPAQWFTVLGFVETERTESHGVER